MTVHVLNQFVGEISRYYPEDIKSKIVGSAITRYGLNPLFHDFKSHLYDVEWIKQEHIASVYNKVNESKASIDLVTMYLGYDASRKDDKEFSELIGQEIDKLFTRTHYFGKVTQAILEKTKEAYLKDLRPYNLYSIMASFEKHTLEKGTVPVIAEIRQSLEFLNSTSLRLYANIMWVIGLANGKGDKNT